MKNGQKMLEALEPILRSGSRKEKDLAHKLIVASLYPNEAGNTVRETVISLLEINVPMQTFHNFFVAVLIGWPQIIIPNSQQAIANSGRSTAKNFLPAFLIALFQTAQYSAEHEEHIGVTHPGTTLCGVLEKMFALDCFYELDKLSNIMAGRLSNAITEFVTYIPPIYLLEKIRSKELLNPTNEDTLAYQIINGLCMRVFSGNSLTEKLDMLTFDFEGAK